MVGKKVGKNRFTHTKRNNRILETPKEKIVKPVYSPSLGWGHVRWQQWWKYPQSGNGKWWRGGGGGGGGGGGNGDPRDEDPDGNNDRYTTVGNGRYDNRSDREFQFVNHRNINIVPFSGRHLTTNPYLPFNYSVRRLTLVQGKVGDDLLEMPDDAEKLGAEKLTKEDLEDSAEHHPKAYEYDRAIKLAFLNCIIGLAHGRVKYGVEGGLDARRTLYHRYVPLAENLQNIMVRELMSFKPLSEQDVDNLFAEIERITELYIKVGTDTDAIQDKWTKAAVMQHLPDRIITNLAIQLKNADSVDEMQRIIIVYLHDHKIGLPRSQGGPLICLAEGEPQTYAAVAAAPPPPPPNRPKHSTIQCQTTTQNRKMES